jgi:hypothetical protein
MPMQARSKQVPTFNAVAFCLLCALAMSYGWGWRGSYGHEAGAMLPGALLGMAVCLGSGRADWHRRTALAGMCGAVGWAWGGALSNMEQTFYVVSDSRPDVLWAFGGIFLVGMLWSGMGSAILSFALTLPRLVLNGFVGPLIANGAALLASFLVLFALPELRRDYFAFVDTHFHDTKVLPATIILVTSSIYWIVRPSERRQAGLFVMGAAAWWAGYLALVKFGGILLAPPNRSESWGGFVGVLAVLLIELSRQRNRAGLRLALGGALSGGFAFVLALFLTHPLVVRWGPFAGTTITNTWKITEESFGFFMGLGVAISALGLIRGRLQSPAEDGERARSDLFAACVLLIVMMWMNLRGNVNQWGPQRYDLLPHDRIGGLLAWEWFFLTGVVLTAVGLYLLWRIHQRTLDALLPPTSFGKGAMLFLLVLWTGQTAVALHRFADVKSGANVLVEVSYWVLAALTTLVLLTRVPPNLASEAQTIDGPESSNTCWLPGTAYWVSWAAVPALLVGFTYGAMAMQNGPHPKGRLRFGPKAFWRTELEKKQKPSVSGAADDRTELETKQSTPK